MKSKMLVQENYLYEIYLHFIVFKKQQCNPKYSVVRLLKDSNK